MRFTAWPAPPIHALQNPPAIPPRFSLFGTVYTVVNGHPVLDIPAAQLDCEALKNAVSSSFAAFTALVDTFDSAYLNSLRDIHVSINEALNKATVFAGPRAMRDAQDERTAHKIEIYQQIKKTIHKGHSQHQE